MLQAIFGGLIESREVEWGEVRLKTASGMELVVVGISDTRVYAEQADTVGLYSIPADNVEWLEWNRGIAEL